MESENKVKTLQIECQLCVLDGLFETAHPTVHVAFEGLGVISKDLSVCTRRTVTCVSLVCVCVGLELF
jgi:hypothetical protein